MNRGGIRSQFAGIPSWKQIRSVIDCQIAVDIAAPPERVWAVLLDVERWHEWTASITSIELLDPGPLRAGSRARVIQPRLPAATWQVTRLAPDRGFFHWAVPNTGVTVTGCHHVEQSGSGTRATLWLEFTGILAPFIAWLLHNQNRRYVTMEAEGLKRRSEQPDSPSATLSS